MFGIGPTEMIIIGIIGVLLFGKRLPEVGKQLGRSLTEFKKGINGVQSEFHAAVNDSPASTRTTATRYSDIDDRDEASAPKFEPPRSEPQAE